MVGLRCTFWLFVFLCLATLCTSDNVWLTRATSFLFRPKRQEFLQGEKVRLEKALHETRQIASLLQEENSELKHKVVSLKSSLQSLKKEFVTMRVEHVKEINELKKSHAKTTGGLRESFKKHRVEELASLKAKLEGEFEVEKKDMVAMLEENHAEEVNSFKNSLRAAQASISQREGEIRALKDTLRVRDQEVIGFVERERLSVSDKEKLLEEIETLSLSLRHIKLAEEARVMDNEGGVVATPHPAATETPAPAAALPQAPQEEPRPEAYLSVPEGLAHTAPHELRAGDPVVVETTSRKVASRKVGGIRSRRPYQTGPTGHNGAYGS